MTECQQFFKALDEECEAKKDGRIRGDRLRAKGAERLQRLIEWESQTASPLSPGPVETTEKIRKALFQGRDIVEGSIHRNAFLPLIDAGLSADRTTKTSPEDSKRRFEEMAAARNKPLYGYIDISVERLRAMRCKENENDSTSFPAIAVYDTAIAANTAHAEAFLIVKFSSGRPWKTVGGDLRDEYKNQVNQY
jgi:hypothetical protein